MAAEKDAAPLSIETALPLYRLAREQLKEAELELAHAKETVGDEPPPAFQEEFDRLSTALQGQRHGLIRALNDRFRSSFKGGRVLVTQGVSARGQGFVTAALAAVQAFTAFDPDNDPHGEHNLGSLTVEGTKLYFKIDYYDPEARFGSDDPADPAMTTRVLTVLLPEEYYASFSNPWKGRWATVLSTSLAVAQGRTAA